MTDKDSKLPESFGKYFWDVDPRKIDLVKNGKYVIARLLEYGNAEAIRWVLKRYPKEEVVETVKQSRQVSPKTANFWALMYSIPREEVRCLEPSYLQLRKQVWPY